ncbi:tetratricopeptide repeat protein [Paracoccus sp. Z330]|uniref:Cell division coordinator CpoB n=1 Tax=Paracoccus onchidii TaxID=3017813 RepID=A0ABT4ZAN3_9RHOB|nr:tetratricopeptide repeat protein [Paracoccus onchidii]MDB6176425.1 tetratricopeptide repeat protein [Paracoccus onchidii]
MKHLAALLLTLIMACLTPAAAQEPNLADLRGDLNQLRNELQSLRSELVASGAAGFQAAGGDAAIDRMNAMERHLTYLTDRVEQLQNRVRRIVADGTRRIDDIEFRLCEMDETCDLGALTTPDLGGLAAGGAASPQVGPAQSGVETAPPGKATTNAEQADFDLARAALNDGDFQRAAQLFGEVAENHAGGPLTAEALFLRGAALDSLGDSSGAAAAWLEGFAASPDGPRAAESLLGLARVIASDGDATASCLYLAEIPARFPGSDAAQEAERRMTVLNCGGIDLGHVDLDQGFATPSEFGNLDPEAAADLADYQ